MTGASKILTVSYGTFSCTLEGFDDPFNTMKAIAEYFRDLAAEDRYFGAEPPTPDAAMLHRIAEREIQRRVEAKVQENGVVLRASDGNPPAVTSDTPPAAKTEPAPVAPRLMEVTPQSAETVAEKLSRLRAEATVQTPAPTTNVTSLALPAAAAYSVPEFEAPDFGEEDYDLPAPAATDPGADDRLAFDADVVADTLPEDRPDPVADLPEDVAPETEAPLDHLAALSAVATDADAAMPEALDTPAETPVPVVSPDATDALLSSLMAGLTAKAATPETAATPVEDDADRSVDPVAEDAAADGMAEAEDDADAWAASGDMAEAKDEAETEAEHEAEDEAEADSWPASDELADADADDETWAAAEDLDETPDAPPALAGEESIAAVLSGEESIFAAEDMQAPAAEPEPVETDAATFSLFAVEDSDDLRASAPADPAPANGTEGLTVLLDQAPEADEDEEEDEPSTALRPDASEKLMRARARVIRIRRGDAAADAPMPAEPSAPAAVLSPEAEADLAAELAALSAVRDDLTDDDDDIEDAIAAADDAASEAASTAAEAGRRAFDDAAADATISRLMAQADEQLEGPESKRRISAIAHLKAAVAATVAERRATGDKPKDAEPSQLSRYRDDLAKVVRNKLGGGSGAAERLAPLVLVSEQRIDRPRPVAAPQPAATAPQTAAPLGASVVPRRIAGAANLAFAQDEDEMEDFAVAIGDSRGFMEFADRLGAKSLGELLEASAAYLACVEGREHFTRPQLMGLVQAAMPEGDIPREDGLRSFGTLLRSGRIEKIRRGQFALSEQSTYLAEGRRIAG